MSVSLGVSTTPVVALAQVAPLDPAEADVSDSDAEMPPLHDASDTDTSGL
jgi:hypothetical protein